MLSGLSELADAHQFFDTHGLCTPPALSGQETAGAVGAAVALPLPVPSVTQVPGAAGTLQGVRLPILPPFSLKIANRFSIQLD